MMRKLGILVIFLLAIANGATGQGQKEIPFKPGYFSTRSKVGVFVVSILESSEMAEGHRFGTGWASIAMFVVTREMVGADKYYSQLKALQKKIAPDSTIGAFYAGYFAGRGKDMVMIPDKIDFQKIKDAETPQGDNAYFGRIISYLKTKYALDQLLVVEIGYGLHLRFDLGKEKERFGSAAIHAELLDFPGRKTIYRSETRQLTAMEITGAPSETEIISAVNGSTQAAVETQRKKLEASQENSH